MWSPVDVVNGEPMAFPYLVRAQYQFQIDGVIAATVLRALARVASRDLTSRVAVLAVDAVESSKLRRIEATEDQRILSLDALSDWDTQPPPQSRWARVADVVARSLDLINVAGSDTLRTNLGGPLQHLAAA